MSARGLGLGRVAALGALIGIAVLVLLVVLRGGGGTYDVIGVFDRAQGLVTGAEVRVGGFTVGRIKKIELPRGGYPHVTMTVDSEYRLRQGAIADLRLASQAGQLNRYIALTQGDGPELEDGATLGLARTDQPVEFDQVVSFLTPRTRREVRSIVANLDRATQGHGPDLDRTLRHSSEALTQTAGLLRQTTLDGAALRRLVDQGSAVIDTVAQEPGEVQGTVDALARTLDATARRQAELTRTVQLLAPGLRSPRLALEQLDRSIPNLRRLVHAAGPAVRHAVPLARDLRPALDDARPALAGARHLTAELPHELRVARKLLADAGPIVDRLEPSVAGLNPFLDHLRATAPDSLGWLTLLGDVLSSYDVNGHGGRLMFIVTGPPNNLVGPSEDAAGLVKRPFTRTPGVLAGEPWEDYEKSFVGGGKPVRSFLTPEELSAP
jgi:phospholipid/cholesterol/gamma-HCH transport system substrate-binding protein